MEKAIVLLSGGLDSTTVLAIAAAQGFECFAISFDYGQRHKSELKATFRIAKTMCVSEHKIIKVDLNSIGGSALTDHDMAVPDYDPHLSQDNKNLIPITYVPARNTIFLSLALGWAEVLGAKEIFIGANIVDYSNYPDCRPEYLNAFEVMANLATRASTKEKPFRIQAPLLYLNKSEIITQGSKLGIDYSITVSCYQADADGIACGLCDSCRYRKKGFIEANIPDPTHYHKKV